jgi:Transposase
MVLIGIDPHKASHTAVVIDRDEQELARVTVRASRGQVGELLAFAAPFTDWRWAIESAGGLGFLLAQQQDIRGSRPAPRSNFHGGSGISHRITSGGCGKSHAGDGAR